MQDRVFAETPAAASCCSDHAAGATCGIGEGNQQCACSASKPVLVSPSSLRVPQRNDGDQAAAAPNADAPSLTLRSGLLVVVACLTSPCCTPLVVPLGMALLAGTPLAFWLTPHLGWIYTALTIVCVSSLILAFFFLRQRAGHPSQLFKQAKQAK
jgi:hypothetical protein